MHITSYLPHFFFILSGTPLTFPHIDTCALLKAERVVRYESTKEMCVCVPLQISFPSSKLQGWKNKVGALFYVRLCSNNLNHLLKGSLLQWFRSTVINSQVNVSEREVSTCSTSCPLSVSPMCCNVSVPGTFMSPLCVLGRKLKCRLWSWTQDAVQMCGPRSGFGHSLFNLFRSCWSPPPQGKYNRTVSTLSK